ncbi:hypothetical protein [Parablautia muri]|uniref:Uncharacterized protein n=1 Tax=Parablautia muri TaxID=2320879 RepID=A0A9X5BKS1_9FIRM|nr:hypothetical protein [Parablautia muri]NBJ94792.1 hypothetical protein [Parablautia muri]
MQKDQIFDKMNGFLTEGMTSLKEGVEIENEFAEGKSAASCMKACTGRERFAKCLPPVFFLSFGEKICMSGILSILSKKIFDKYIGRRGKHAV